MSPAERRFGAFLRALAKAPGQGWRLLTATALTTGSVLRNAVVGTVVLLAVVMLRAVPFGWWRFRRTARV
jgi:hypothetical protein